MAMTMGLLSAAEFLGASAEGAEGAEDIDAGKTVAEHFGGGGSQLEATPQDLMNSAVSPDVGAVVGNHPAVTTPSPPRWPTAGMAPDAAERAASDPGSTQPGPRV